MLQHTYPGDFSKTHCTGEFEERCEIAAEDRPVVPEMHIDDRHRLECVESGDPERRIIIDHRAEPARWYGDDTCVARRSGAATQFHASDTVALAMHTHHGLTEVDAVETSRRSLGESREWDLQIRDPCGIAVTEKRGADGEQPHLCRDAMQRRIERRHEKRLPERAQRASTLMMPAQPRGHVATGISIRSCGDERAANPDTVERRQMWIAGEACHQVERRRQIRRPQLSGRATAGEHGDLEPRLDVQRVTEAKLTDEFERRRAAREDNVLTAVDLVSVDLE